MTTFRTALSLVCVVMVSGCGGSTPVKHTSKTNGGAAHTAAPQINTGILVKPTSRPPDVSEQFDYVGGAGPGNCQIDPAVVTKPAIKFFAQPFSGSPAESPDAQRLPGQATFGQAVDICFDGFGQGPVTVEVRAPDASTIAGVLPRLPPTEKSGDGWAAYDWVPELDPSWPLGRYVVSARAGSLQARTAFVLTPPATAGIRVVGPSTDPGHNEVAADSQAKVYLTGFRGTPSLRLVVYKVKQTGYTQTGSSSARSRLQYRRAATRSCGLPPAIRRRERRSFSWSGPVATYCRRPSPSPSRSPVATRSSGRCRADKPSRANAPTPGARRPGDLALVHVSDGVRLDSGQRMWSGSRA